MEAKVLKPHTFHYPDWHYNLSCCYRSKNSPLSKVVANLVRLLHNSQCQDHLLKILKFSLQGSFKKKILHM